MVDRPFLANARWQEQQWRARRDGAHPKILLFEKRLIRKLEKAGLPFFAHNMVRTAAEQTELYVRNVSKARAGRSPHNFGCAVDIVHSVRAWNLTKLEWQLIGHIGKEVAALNHIKIVWGGDWDFYDPAHWELKDWRTHKSGFPFPNP